MHLLLLLAACTKGDEAPIDTEPQRTPGEDQTVTVFAEEYVNFGAENRRVVNVEVELPDADTTYERILGRFSLTCPNRRCDWWDRYGTFGILLDPEAETPTYVELDRFITAYRVGFEWEADLTPLRPLLTGPQTFQVFIDTWVGEGHENGDGWLFDAQLDFVGGPPPSPEAVEVVPAWGHLSWQAGLDDNPVEGQVAPQSLSLPDADSWTLRSFISGHGWNNRQNCAEFCPKEHFYSVNGQEWGREVWRDDCSDTVTDGVQRGTWEYARAGWCPGAQVFPWDIDVSDAIEGGEAEVSYRLQDFAWAGDGDQPYYYMSGVLIGFDG